MATPSITTKPAIDAVPSFKRVLLATDFCAASDAAFQTAVRVCTELQASLVVLHVFEYGDRVPGGGGRLAEMERIYDKALRSLYDAVETAKKAGIPTEAMMKGGVAAPSILEELPLRQIDLVIMGTNALHGFERMVFGSTAEEVLRQAACPVLTVGPQAAQVAEKSTFGCPVVFATDFHPTTKKAIYCAATLSKQTNSSLHCLHILPRAVQGAIIPNIMIEALRQMALESGCTIDKAEFAIGYGSEISTAVVDYARQHKAALVVLGVSQASMIASHAPAHIAYRIITEAPCPVLTIAYPTRSTSILAAAACL